jgi:hypothetical protein
MPAFRAAGLLSGKIGRDPLKVYERCQSAPFVASHAFPGNPAWMKAVSLLGATGVALACVAQDARNLIYDALAETINRRSRPR